MRKSLFLLCAFFCTSIAMSMFYSCRNLIVDDCSFPNSQKCAVLQTAELTPLGEDGHKVIDSGKSFNAKEFQLIATLRGTSYICYRKINRNPFVNSAYACDPPPPSYVLKDDGIVSRAITCNKDFDSNHPAGSNLLDLFNTNNGGGNVNENYSDDFSNDNIGVQRFYLDQTPEKVGEYIFTVRYELVSGTVVEATAVPVILQF